MSSCERHVRERVVLRAPFHSRFYRARNVPGALAAGCASAMRGASPRRCGTAGVGVRVNCGRARKYKRALSMTMLGRATPKLSRMTYGRTESRQGRDPGGVRVGKTINPAPAREGGAGSFLRYPGSTPRPTPRDPVKEKGPAAQNQIRSPHTVLDLRARRAFRLGLLDPQPRPF